MIQASLIYLFSSLLNKIVPFLLLPLLTRYLSPSEYGIIAIVQVFIALFQSAYGVLNVNIPRTYFKLNNQQFSSYMGAVIFVLVIIFICTAFLSIIYFLSGFTLVGLDVKWFFAMPIVAFMSMANLLNLTLLRTQEKPFQYAAWEISHTILNLSVSLIFVIVFQAGWEGRALGITIPLILYGCLGLFALKQKKYYPVHLPWSYVKETFAVSLPLIPHALSAVVITSSDRFFIKEILGVDSVGVYTVAYQFGMVIMLFTDSFLKAWQPWFYKMLSYDSLTKKYLITINTYFYLIALIVGALIYSKISRITLLYVVDERYFSAGPVIFPVVLSYIAFGFYQIFYPYIVHIRKTYVMLFISSFSAIMNLFFNYLLIPTYGINGAAYATIISYSISAILVFIVVVKCFDMPWLNFCFGELKNDI